MAKKRQPITQEKDRDDGQEKATNNTRKGLQRWPRRSNQEHKRMTITMAMATKNISKNAKGWQQWPRRAQPRMQEDNHDDGQEERNQKHKRMTTTIAKRSEIKNTRKHDDVQEERN